MTLEQVFFCEFSEISKNIFLAEYVWATAYIKHTQNGYILFVFFISRWHVIVQTHRNKKLNILTITCQSKEKKTNNIYLNC